MIVLRAGGDAPQPVWDPAGGVKSDAQSRDPFHREADWHGS